MREMWLAVLSMIATTFVGAAHYLNAAIPDPLKGLLMLLIAYKLLRFGDKTFFVGYSQATINTIVLGWLALFIGLEWLIPPRLNFLIEPAMTVTPGVLVTWFVVKMYLHYKEPLHSYLRGLRRP